MILTCFKGQGLLLFCFLFVFRIDPSIGLSGTTHLRFDSQTTEEKEKLQKGQGAVP